MIFLLPRWDMLVPWSVFLWIPGNKWHPWMIFSEQVSGCHRTDSLGLTVGTKPEMIGLKLDHVWLGGGFTYFLCSSPYFGEDEPILTHIFQMGWNHQADEDVYLWTWEFSISHEFASLERISTWLHVDGPLTVSQLGLLTRLQNILRDHARFFLGIVPSSTCLLHSLKLT